MSPAGLIFGNLCCNLQLFAGALFVAGRPSQLSEFRGVANQALAYSIRALFPAFFRPAYTLRLRHWHGRIALYFGLSLADADLLHPNRQCQVRDTGEASSWVVLPVQPLVELPLGAAALLLFCS